MGERVGVDDYLGPDGKAATVEGLPTISYTPVMAEDAFYGLAGRIVREIEPYTEADPVAVLGGSSATGPCRPRIVLLLCWKSGRSTSGSCPRMRFR